jgi:photosystem II stability/assembly factor-like uncharacterized protein
MRLRTVPRWGWPLLMAALAWGISGSAAIRGAVGSPTSFTARVAGPVTTPTPTLIDFPDARHGFVAATVGPHQAELLVTVNAGATFTPHRFPAGWEPAAMDFSSSESGTVVANRCSGQGRCDWTLWRTADGGRHWTRAWQHGPLGQPGRPSPIAMQIFPSGAGFMTAGGFLWHAAPAHTWAREPALQGLEVVAEDFLGPAQGWVAVDRCTPAGCNAGELLVTQDGGQHWSVQLTEERPMGTVDFVSAKLGFLFLPPPPGTFTMGGAEGTLLRTTDGGRHWTVIQQGGIHPWEGGHVPQNGFQGGPVFFNGQDGWVPVSTGAGPGTAGLQVTTDGGLRWHRVGARRSWEIGSVDPVGPKNVWITGVAGVNGGPTFLLHSIDGGRRWQELLPALRPTQAMTMFSARTGLGIGSPTNLNQVLVTHNGGRTWRKTGALPVLPAPVVSGFANPRQGWALSADLGGRIWVTTDGGRRWHQGPRLPSVANPGVGFFMLGRRRAVVAATPAQGKLVLLATTNAGRTWHPYRLAHLHPPCVPGVVTVAPDGRVWVVATRPGSSFTVWTGSHLAASLRAVLAPPLEQNQTLWLNAVTAGPGAGASLLVDRMGRQGPGAMPAPITLWLYHTTDGGRHWMRIGLAPGLTAAPVWVTAQDALMLTGSGLFVTRDAGRVWRLLTPLGNSLAR